MYRISVDITAPVNDTELSDRVEDAITNLFPGADPVERNGELHGRVHALDHFSQLLHEQAILDTARGEFFANREGDTFSFELKKQAAFQGVVNFAVGDSDELGDIHVRVCVEEPSVKEFVDLVVPLTEDGRPIES